MEGLLPVRSAGALAGKAIALLAAAGLLVGLAGGSAALSPFLLGIVAGATAAVSGKRDRTPWTIAALSAAAAAAGAAVQGNTAMAVVLVVIAGLLQAPLNRRARGIGVMLPALVAYFATAGDLHPLVAALWVGSGAITILAVTEVLKLHTSLPQLPSRVAWPHALATAIACAVAIGISLHNGLPQGYWLVLTIALVLRPDSKETLRAVVNRIAGTIGGVAIAIAIAAVAPAWLAVILGAACLWLGLSFAVEGKDRRNVLWAAPAIVLFSAVGGSSVTSVAVSRLLWSITGALIAAALALALWRLDSRDPAPTG